jgi:dipeptide/tripeptide permease
VACGGIKPVVCVFGADQIPNGHNAAKNKERFYNFWYFAVMLGAVFYGPMGLMGTAPQKTFGISDSWGYFAAYSTATGVMLIGVLVYFAGSPFYLRSSMEKNESAARQLFGIMLSSTNCVRGVVGVFGWSLTIPYLFLVFYQAKPNIGHWVAKAAFLVFCVQIPCLIWAHSDNSWIGLGRDESERATGLSLRDVRLSFQSLPVILVVSSTFNVVFRLTQSKFAYQVCQMDLNVGGGLQFSDAIINIFNSLGVMLGIAILEGALYPMLRMHGMQISLNTKLIIGLLLAGASTLSALALEVARRDSTVLAPPGWFPDAAWDVRFPGIPSNTTGAAIYMGVCIVDGVDYCSNCAKKTKLDGIEVGMYMSNMSMFWMIVPYFVVGIAEALVNPLLQYYAYAFTPERTRAVIQGVCLLFIGMYPEAVSAVFTLWMNDSIPNNLNETRKFWGLEMGIDAFYLVGLVFVVPAVPLVIFVVKFCAALAPEQNSHPTETLDVQAQA